jgi:hypothetical protein
MVGAHIADLARGRRGVVLVILVAAAWIRSIIALMKWLDFNPLIDFDIEYPDDATRGSRVTSENPVSGCQDDFRLWEAAFATMDGIA